MRHALVPALDRYMREEEVPPLVFNSGLTTLTPSMAKREGSVFAAAPAVQGAMAGDGTPDVLTFSRGSQIVGNWYGRFDPYQGGGFVNWKPEQTSGARTGLAYIWYISAAYNLAYDYANGRYSLNIGTQTMTYTQAITAGTVEYLAWGFDCANKIDGTNYAYLSRNDVQGFGITTQPTVSAPGATPAIGSNGATLPSNAIIEGLVFTRVVPWTGSYGTDLGQGDLVAIHAAGADIAETIGSWDTPLSVPTDASVGALVTGEGEAWSHPHSSNLIPGNSNTGGWMADGTYTTDGWSDEGTPSAVAALAAAESIFAGWGYKTTSDAADEGLYQDVTVTAGDDFVIRVIANSDGTSVPRAILYDQDNGAEIGHLDGSTASTKAAPDVLVFTGQAPAGCTTVRVKLINTAASGVTYWHQVELYDNLITNPSFATGAGDPWIPTGWANSGLDAGDTQASSTGGAVIHSGAEALQVDAGAVTGEGIYDALGGLVENDYFATGFWFYGDGSAISELREANARFDNQAGGTYALVAASTAAWQSLKSIARANVTNANFNLLLAARACATGARYADDVYAVALSPVSLTATPASEANSAESGGIRVDGRDTLTQPTVNYLRANEGRIMWRMRPRHAPADVSGFGDYSSLYWLQTGLVAGKYLQLRSDAANILNLFIADATGNHYVNADITGLWSADEEMLCEIQYRGPNAWLRINGVTVATLTTLGGFGANVPTTIYWGSFSDGSCQPDAVFIGL